MKKIKLIIVIIVLAITQTRAQEIAGPMQERFSVRIVANKLSDPWEVTYGSTRLPCKPSRPSHGKKDTGVRFKCRTEFSAV
jgi:hypothetical protein